MKRQHGMALLVVLLLLALMSVLVSQMTQRYRLVWQKGINSQVAQQQRWYLLGGESYIGRVLSQGAHDESEKTTLTQYWAVKGKVFPVENSKMSGEVVDRQACFNINSLLSYDESAATETQEEITSYREQVFFHLLRLLDVEELRAQQITAAVKDWLDTNRVAQQYGAEDNDYLAMAPPYLSANQPMQDMSELRMVKGVDASLYRRLRLYLCALPESTLEVNINTLSSAQAPLLSALFHNRMSVEDAKRIITKRPREGWSSVTEFLQQDDLSKIIIVDDDVGAILSVKSFYFESRLQVQTENQKTSMTSLFQRQSNNQMRVIRRHFGEVW